MADDGLLLPCFVVDAGVSCGVVGCSDRVGADVRADRVGAVVRADRVGAVVRMPWRCCGDGVVDGSVGTVPNRVARAASRCC